MYKSFWATEDALKDVPFKIFSFQFSGKNSDVFRSLLDSLKSLKYPCNLGTQKDYPHCSIPNLFDKFVSVQRDHAILLISIPEQGEQSKNRWHGGLH